MLRKVATSEGKYWDKLVPYLLFAYCEVPQASTGFSPFELLYGKIARRPLDVLCETWEVSKQSEESYVLSMCEKLKDMAEIVQKNLAKSQDKQKRWYDKNGKFREFSPGDPVMVLLPTRPLYLISK